jgi:2-dehydropantoate 2-reductase
MGKRIAVVGAGGLGGYVGGYLAQGGHDVTLIDGWPENIEAIRKRGLELDGVTPEEQFTVTNAKTMHLTEVQQLAKQKPIDIAFVSVKSYDTEWATLMIRQYLAENGYIVSLQNCLNEEKIAGIVGWGKVVGAIASSISVDMHEAARIRRTVAKGGDKHTVFRIGEVHGRVTSRVEELVDMIKPIDSVKPTSNLWGERWSKLCLNGMRNGVSAATGLTSSDCDRDDAIRRFSIKLGGEAVRVGQALGYSLEKIGKLDPERLAQASEGKPDAVAEIEALMTPPAIGSNSNPRANIQRPSMAQDMLKGRRTEIRFMNGYVADKGAEIGVPAPSHVKLTEVVTRVERGEAKQSPTLLGGKG